MGSTRDSDVEFRRTEDGKIDEILIGKDAWFHLEMMDDNLVWFAVYLNGDKRLACFISAKGKLSVKAEVE